MKMLEIFHVVQTTFYLISRGSYKENCMAILKSRIVSTRLLTKVADYMSNLVPQLWMVVFCICLPLCLLNYVTWNSCSRMGGNGWALKFHAMLGKVNKRWDGWAFLLASFLVDREPLLPAFRLYSNFNKIAKNPPTVHHILLLICHPPTYKDSCWSCSILYPTVLVVVFFGSCENSLSVSACWIP